MRKNLKYITAILTIIGMCTQMPIANAKDIYFYHTGSDHDIYSNVTDLGCELELSGKKCRSRSTESFFQGIKGLVKSPKEAMALILDQNTPGSHLQKRGRKFRNPIYDQPFKNMTVKEKLMEELLLAKATQNIEVAKALLNTGNTTIIENTALASYDDSFWGNGLKGNGHNGLGKAWMRVRATLQKELANQGFISVRSGLSNELATTLQIPNHRPNSQYHPSKIITQKDLNVIPLCTTVSAIHNLRHQNFNANTAPGSFSASAASAILPVL